MKNKNSIQLDICEKESIANNVVTMQSFLHITNIIQRRCLFFMRGTFI